MPPRPAPRLCAGRLAAQALRAPSAAELRRLRRKQSQSAKREANPPAIMEVDNGLFVEEKNLPRGHVPLPILLHGRV